MTVSPDITRADIDRARKLVCSALARGGRTDGGAFDPERHPNLMQPTRDFNCIAHHVLSVSDVDAWTNQQRIKS